MDRNVRIALLWVVIMVGYCVHTLVDLLPIFFAGSVAMPDATGQVPTAMYAFAGFIMFLLPVAGALLASYAKARAGRILHLVLAALLTLANIFHLGDLFKEFNWGQCMVLPLILLLSVLLLWEAVQSLKHPASN